ncbi:MAG TPA: hypothetical protein VFG72_04485 [Marmoricola sp.]|nr:hypothetical protein [Marmoricola sp.]
MSRTVYLHVGLPKSGTSYLQRLLSANKERLEQEAALLFPGKAWNEQVLAVKDVRGIRDGRPRRFVDGAWDRLVAEIHGWPGDAIVSMEWLCAASDPQISRILESLAPSDVQVLFTARDLGRTLPAAWQEFMQNQHTWSWDEFLSAVATEDRHDTAPGRTFWAQQDLPVLVARWSAHVGTDRTHVITLPQPGAPRDVLWRRLASVLEVDPAGYVTEDLGGNESLGLESAELMRRVNRALRETGAGRRSYNRVFKHQLAKQVLSRRRGQESVLTVPESYRDWIDATAGRQVDAIAAAGVHVVGDLDELRPTHGATALQPSELPDGALLDAAVAGLVGLGTIRDSSRPTGPGEGQPPAPRRAPGGATPSRRQAAMAKARRLAGRALRRVRARRAQS